MSEDWPEYVRRSEKYNQLIFYNIFNNSSKINSCNFGRNVAFISTVIKPPVEGMPQDVERCWTNSKICPLRERTDPKSTLVIFLCSRVGYTWEFSSAAKILCGAYLPWCYSKIFQTLQGLLLPSYIQTWAEHSCRLAKWSRRCIWWSSWRVISG